MHKITSVRIEYEDGSTAQFNGDGTFHVHNTEIKSESRRDPGRALTWVSVNLLVRPKEQG